MSRIVPNAAGCGFSRPALLPGIAGLVIALVMGLIGGLLPAIRAARLPVTTALRTA